MAKGKIRWLGHATVEFTTADNKVILFDPWTKDDGNPACPLELRQIERADLVLVSHDHGDHIASAVKISEKTGALVGAPVQTAHRLNAEGFSKDKLANFGFGYMVGGGVRLDWVDVVTTPAFHSSDTACALGHIVRAADGTTVYHAGDTCVFGDMKLWGDMYPLDVALLPIGGIFTMDAYQAATAAALLGAKLVVPIHYRSFPSVAESADEFVDRAAKQAPDVRVAVLAPGETLELG